MRYLLLIALAFLLISPAHLNAHVLKISGDIGITMHLDPDDDPIANQKTNVYLEFKDRTNKFKFENCDCSIQVIKDGKTLETSNINNSSLTSAAYSFTFPEKAIYQIQIKGNSKNNSFTNFEVSFEVRVARDSTNASSNNNIPIILTVVLIIGVIVFFFYYSRKLSNKKIQ